MHQDDGLIEYIRELLAPLGATSARKMFGGHGVYHDGLMICIVIDGALFLKTDEETRPQFKAAGCAPFIYESKGKRVEMSYWSTPEEAMDSAAAMTPWARLAYAAAVRKANAKPVRKPRTVKK